MVEVRGAEEADRRPLALLFAAVAEERDGIAAEPPVGLERREAGTDLERALVAVAGGGVVGSLVRFAQGLLSCSHVSIRAPSCSCSFEPFGFGWC